MKKVIFGLATILAITVTFGTAYWHNKSQKGNENDITVGAILPLSGDGAKYGDSAKMGMDLAVEQINSNGGIKGKHIRILYEDTLGDPKTGIAAFKKLTTVNNVQVVLGDLLSSVTLSVAPVANEKKIVLLSPASSAPKLTTAGDYIFRNCPSDIYEGSIMASFAYDKLNIKNISILRINNEYGVGISDAFKQAFKAKGGFVIHEESFNEKDTDFRSQITKISKNNPSAVYLLGYKQMGYILRQSKELGLKTQYLSTVTFEDPEIIKVAGDATNGVIYSASSFDPNGKNNIVHNFTVAFEKKYHSKPDIFAGLSFDAVKILSLAMAHGETSGEEIKNALYKVKGYQGVAGETSFDANGDAVLTPVLKTVRNEKFEFLQ